MTNDVIRTDDGGAPDARERVENDARRDKITLQASYLSQAALWMECNASTLARIGVGDFNRVLFGIFNSKRLTFYVYGDRATQTQTLAAVRTLLVGEWEEERSGKHVHLTQEIVTPPNTGSRGFAIEFLAIEFFANHGDLED